MNILIFDTKNQRTIKKQEQTIYLFSINFILLTQIFKFKSLLFKRPTIATLMCLQIIFSFIKSKTEFAYAVGVVADNKRDVVFDNFSGQPIGRVKITPFSQPFGAEFGCGLIFF